APPARPLAADERAAVSRIQLARTTIQLRHQDFHGALAEPANEGGVERAPFRGVTFHAQQLASRRNDSRPARSSGDVNAPDLTVRAERDELRRKGLRRRRIA